MREHLELVYTPQNRGEKGIVYFLLHIIFRAIFFFNIGEPRKYLDLFESGKIRISVFYIREHTQLVYILQNRVE